MKTLLALLLAAALAAVWLYRRASEPEEAPFARASRGLLVSTLPTNGKAEPVEWRTVHAEEAGRVERTAVREGDTVNRGALLAVVASETARTSLAAAEARLLAARAELSVIAEGGRKFDRTGLAGELDQLAVERGQLARELESVERLAEKGAATRAEADELRRRIARLDSQREALAQKAAALVSVPDRTAAEARVREAETAVAAARLRLSGTEIRTPIAGSVYSFPVRAGAFLRPGDTVAQIGRLDRLLVRVFVDEPELGRVAPAQPVRVTWDALPGESWTGEVERTAIEIRPLGTRQVGEVLCTIGNAAGTLPPGANVNVEIRTAAVENALHIPREALRRVAGDTGVWILRGDAVAWQPVSIGVTGATRAQILEDSPKGTPSPSRPAWTWRRAEKCGPCSHDPRL
ncbi:MAG: efflux RND transporter periplasmic adaptor subunit [Bryobacterales bacterium]|nr:efflux RND transporter periplasmic adaptor subunit [Bryobacterales bacterium]